MSNLVPPSLPTPDVDPTVCLLMLSAWLSMVFTTVVGGGGDVLVCTSPLAEVALSSKELPC